MVQSKLKNNYSKMVRFAVVGGGIKVGEQAENSDRLI